MTLRIKNAQDLGYASPNTEEKESEDDFGNLNRFPVYFGTHPKVMHNIICSHKPSIEDWHRIKKEYFWNPLLWFRIRYKTPKRVKHKIKK